MAGRKQHYIPQSLLRGFEASRSGKKSQVVVYGRGATPFVTSTEGVAAQKDFYSKPSTDDVDTLDDLITNFETERFNPILIALRSVRNGQVDAQQAATAVVHLTIRSAHVRRSFVKFSQELLDHFGVVLQSSEATREFAGIDSVQPDSLLVKEIERTLDSLQFVGLPAKDRTVLEKLICFRVREKFDESIQGTVPTLQKQILSMEQAYPAAIEKGHLNSLERSLVSESRMATLMKLDWKVICVDSQHFVLPDCLAIAGVGNKVADMQPYTMSSDVKLTVVAMPISSTQVLIGSRDDVKVDPLLLNLEFARCSFEFFVSSKIDPHADQLAKEIGTEIAATTEFQIKGALPLPGLSSEPVPGKRPSENLRVQIRFPRGTHRAEEIEAAIRRLFAGQCGVSEAERLDSITIVQNVPNAVAELRSKQLTLKESQEVALGAVEFVSTGDVVRIRLFLSIEVAALLLLPKEGLEHQRAAYLVMHNLGRLTYLDYSVQSIKEASSTEKPSPMMNLGLEFVQRFGSHYFGARIAGSGANAFDDLETSADFFAQVLTATLSALDTARKKFWINRIVDELASDAFAALDILLVTAAAACGFHESKGVALPANSSAGTVLQRSGLWDWFQLFDRDLQQHFENRGQWQPVEETSRLAAHADRILWEFGIFVSESHDHQLWIDVCDDTKLQAIKQTLRS